MACFATPYGLRYAAHCFNRAYAQNNCPALIPAGGKLGVTSKTVGTKRPLTQKQIWAIRFHLDREGRLRDKALFDLAIDSKLRGYDLVKIKIGDVVAGTDVRTRAIVIQQKTSRPVQFELTSDVRATLLSWLERRCGSITDYLFPSRI